MNMSVLLVLCLVTLSFSCTHTVVRITAAVYEALSPFLNEMRENISSMNHDILAVKNELGTLSNFRRKSTPD